MPRSDALREFWHVTGQMPGTVCSDEGLAGNGRFAGPGVPAAKPPLEWPMLRQLASFQARRDEHLTRNRGRPSAAVSRSRWAVEMALSTIIHGQDARRTLTRRARPSCQLAGQAARRREPPIQTCDPPDLDPEFRVAAQELGHPLGGDARKPHRAARWQCARALQGGRRHDEIRTRGREAAAGQHRGGHGRRRRSPGTRALPGKWCWDWSGWAWWVMCCEAAASMSG